MLNTILIASEDILKTMPSGRRESTLQTRFARCVRHVELSATRFANCDGSLTESCEFRLLMRYAKAYEVMAGIERYEELVYVVQSVEATNCHEAHLVDWKALQ